jgi:hypothetical protein
MSKNGKKYPAKERSLELVLLFTDDLDFFVVCWWKRVYTCASRIKNSKKGCE